MNKFFARDNPGLHKNAVMALCQREEVRCDEVLSGGKSELQQDEKSLGDLRTNAECGEKPALRVSSFLEVENDSVTDGDGFVSRVLEQSQASHGGAQNHQHPIEVQRREDHRAWSVLLQRVARPSPVLLLYL